MRRVRRRASRYPSKGRYGVGVTNKYDRASVYTKRRMPFRKRKRWTNFVKKVRAAENTTLGTRTRVFNDRFNMSKTSSDSSSIPVLQVFDSLGLYTNQGTNSYKDKDLYKIVTEDTDVKNTTQIGMISGILDMTLVNKSTDAAGSPMGVELDIYLLTARKQFVDSNFVGQLVVKNIEAILNDGLNQSAEIGGLGKLNTADVGVTPFDCTLALSSYGIKIHNKKKYFLASGNQMTYQIRDPKNRRFSKDKILNTYGQNMPGATKFLLVISKGLPGAERAGSQYKVNLEVGVTRKYAYKINEDSQDKTA